MNPLPKKHFVSPQTENTANDIFREIEIITLVFSPFTFPSSFSKKYLYKYTIFFRLMSIF